MKKLKYIILIFLCMATSLQMKAVDVTLTTDENVNRPAGIYNAERNLAAVLTEINRAQKAHVPVSVKNLQMDEFSKKSLARLWAVTPFYCDDEEVVERCWVFKNGT